MEDENGVKPLSKTDDEWGILNRKAVGQFRQWVDESVFQHVAKEVDAYNIGKKIRDSV